MRITLVVFAVAVLAYSLWFEGTAIYDMVAMAYQFPVVGAFTGRLSWGCTGREPQTGAWTSILAGGTAWLLLTVTPMGEVFPSVLGDSSGGWRRMVIGSLLPTRSNARYHRLRALQALAATPA